MTLCVRSQVALFASVFFCCVSFSVVLPTLWPYLQSLNASTSYLALVVAIYSVGEALGGLLFGALCTSQKSAMSLTLATLIGLLGSVLYVAAQRFPHDAGPHLVLVARALHGVWTGGVQALQQVYLANVLQKDALSTVTVTMSGFANLGFVFGPVFALLASLVPSFPTWPGLSFDQLTAPGYFVLLTGLLNIVLYLAVLDERTDRAAAANTAVGSVQDEAALRLHDEEQPLLADPGRGARDESGNGFMFAAIICNIVCFTHFLGFAIQETVTTPLVQRLFNWSVMSANELFTAGGVTSLLGVISLAFTTRVLSDRMLTVLTVCLGVCGYILLLCSVPTTAFDVGATGSATGSASAPRFVGGFLLCMVAFPTGRAAVLSLYTKILPAKKQGLGQGVFLAAGALARVAGPFWAVRAVGPDAPWVFGCTAAAFVACLAMLGGWFRHLDTGDCAGDADARADAIK